MGIFIRPWDFPVTHGSYERLARFSPYSTLWTRWLNTMKMSNKSAGKARGMKERGLVTHLPPSLGPGPALASLAPGSQGFSPGCCPSPAVAIRAGVPPRVLRGLQTSLRPGLHCPLGRSPTPGNPLCPYFLFTDILLSDSFHVPLLRPACSSLLGFSSHLGICSFQFLSTDLKRLLQLVLCTLFSLFLTVILTIPQGG